MIEQITIGVLGNVHINDEKLVVFNATKRIIDGYLAQTYGFDFGAS
jgi:hypothetical protein